MKNIPYFVLFFALVSCIQEKKESVNQPDDLYRFNSNLSPRWVSFENSTGAKGSGGMENNGGKGHPSDQIKAGETKIFLDIEDHEGFGNVPECARYNSPRPSIIV